MPPPSGPGQLELPTIKAKLDKGRKDVPLKANHGLQKSRQTQLSGERYDIGSTKPSKSYLATEQVSHRNNTLQVKLLSSQKNSF